jgi:excinuclease ABC subunit A
MHLSGGLALINVVDGEDIMFSQKFACTDCGISIEELEPRMFSFNNPFGACPTCTGLGRLLKIDPDIVIPDKTRSLGDGAINAIGWSSSEDSYSRMYFEALAKRYSFDINTPIKDLPDHIVDIILYGTKGEKIRVNFERSYGNGSFMAPFEGV